MYRGASALKSKVIANNRGEKTASSFKLLRAYSNFRPMTDRETGKTVSGNVSSPLCRTVRNMKHNKSWQVLSWETPSSLLQLNVPDIISPRELSRVRPGQYSDGTNILVQKRCTQELGVLNLHFCSSSWLPSSLFPTYPMCHTQCAPFSRLPSFMSLSINTTKM